MTEISQNKAALVTGAARRIGAALSLKLAEMGYDIALHYNASRSQAETLAEQIEAKGVRCALFQEDLGQSAASDSLISSVTDQFPRLHMLINNASVFRKDALRGTKEQQFDLHFNIHLKSPYFLSKAFASHVDNGHVINILDTKIVQQKTEHFSYLLSKKALADLTRMSAVELAPDIRVNGISPGLILPPEDQDNLYLDARAKDIPLKRRGDIMNITQTLEFLVTNDFLTGQIIAVDGGEFLV